MVSFRMSLTDLNCVSRKLKLEGCDRERVAVVKYRMDNGGCNGAGCFEVKIWADTAKFTNVIVARFRRCSDWYEKVRCSSKIKQRLRAKWVEVREELCILESCCLSPIRKKISFRRVESEKIGSHPGRDLLWNIL